MNFRSNVILLQVEREFCMDSDEETTGGYQRKDWNFSQY